MVRTILAVLLFALPAYAQVELDVAAVPGLNEAGRQAYADFLLADLPRAFAIGSNGAYGYYGSDGYRVGSGNIEVARAGALQSCTARGATDCALYAENLDVVWQSHSPAPNLVPIALNSTWTIRSFQTTAFSGTARRPQLAFSSGVTATGRRPVPVPMWTSVEGNPRPMPARSMMPVLISYASTATRTPITATALRDGWPTLWRNSRYYVAVTTGIIGVVPFGRLWQEVTGKIFLRGRSWRNTSSCRQQLGLSAQPR